MLKKIKQQWRYYILGRAYASDTIHRDTKIKSSKELRKLPKRFTVINAILETFSQRTNYLEIGVRFPDDNFNKIKADQKYGVDPGVENNENPVDFKMTSDVFFEALKQGEVLNKDTRFHVIFIDGLHTAEQTETDIYNALEFITEDGFVVLHDCNPPTEYHAREDFNYHKSPAGTSWNGTTWKAFVKFGQQSEYYSCCIDADWGVGVISKKVNLGKPSKVNNPYFTYSIFNKNRVKSLNLMSFEDFKKRLQNSTKVIFK